MTRKTEPTTLEFAILALLAGQPQSGYDLLTLFESTAMGNFSSSPGAIYPALARLEKRGLIQGTVDESLQLRPKRIFRPTPDGERSLRAWLQAALTPDDVRRHFDRVLLRFAFHSLLGPKATHAFLSDLARRIDEHVAELQEQHGNLSSDDAPPHGRMALELGIEHYRTSARWARRMLRYFEEESS